MRLEEELRARARELGFDELRITRAHLPREVRAGFRAFVRADVAGDMSWLVARPQLREHPRALWPEARSAVVVGVNYGPERDPRSELARPDRGYIALYARRRDYHLVLKGRLKQLGAWLAARAGARVRLFVDTAPVLEKPLAHQAGLGWQGKHTNLVSRRYGSWLFLGGLLTDLDLAPDAPEPDRCGRCHRCMEACPTGAIPAPYRLDPRRCIAYLTIEHKGPIPRALRPLIGNRVFGCDDCLLVCPWNKFARRSREAKLALREDLSAPSLAELLELDEPAYRRRFARTPLRRTGHIRFLRNVLIAAGNSRCDRLVPLVRRHLDHAAALVRGAAVWAYGRLAAAAARNEALHRMETEPDPDVREEWRALAGEPAMPDGDPVVELGACAPEAPLEADRCG